MDPYFKARDSVPTDDTYPDYINDAPVLSLANGNALSLEVVLALPKLTRLGEIWVAIHNVGSCSDAITTRKAMRCAKRGLRICDEAPFAFHSVPRGSEVYTLLSRERQRLLDWTNATHRFIIDRLTSYGDSDEVKSVRCTITEHLDAVNPAPGVYMFEPELRDKLYMATQTLKALSLQNLVTNIGLWHTLAVDMSIILPDTLTALLASVKDLLLATRTCYTTR